MSGWTLPPIGTKDHPFNGHLDGYDTTYSKTDQTQPVTIKNLTVSNDFSAYGSRHPANVTSSTFSSPEITGLFGYIASDSTSSSKPAPSVKNLYIDSETVNSTTDNALTGIVAGYVDGELEGIHLDNSKVNVKDGTNNISGFDNISEYTSVGCTTNKSSYVKNVTTLYEPYFVGKSDWNDKSGGSGQDTGWGSSIDMQVITRRVNYINAVASKPYAAVYESSSYSCYDRALGGAAEKHWKGSGVTAQYYHLYSGTYLPLSINTASAWTTSDGSDETTTGTNSGWHTTQYYLDHKDSDGEYSIIADNNSGYLVGGGGLTSTGSIDNSGSDGYGYVTLRFNTIANSISGSTTSTTYDSSATVYSVDTRSGTTNTEITNSNYTDFGYSKYSTVKTDFDNIHTSINTHMYGFHFYPMNEQSNNFKSDMVKAKLFGKEYSEYQFLKGALNFTTKTDGIVTTMIATYYSNKDALFDLFNITRDSSNKITSITRIKKIYKDSKGNIIYDPTSEDGLTKVFDFDNVTYSSDHTSNYLQKQKALYYFEIPLKAGDYAIGKSKDTVTGTGTSNSIGASAYVLYLDIGANAGSGSETTSDHVYRTKVLELLKQINSTFTYPSGVYITDLTTTDIINDKKTYCVQLGKAYSGAATMDVSGDTATTSLTAISTDTGVAYFDDSLTVSENGTTITIDNALSESKVETQTIRLTYYDHYYGDETDELYVYMMETSSSSEIPATFTGYTGSKANDGTYTLSTGGKEKFYDDNGDEAEVSSISSSEYDISSVNTSTPVISLRNVDTFTYLPTSSIGDDNYYGSAFNSSSPTPSGYNITATAISGKEVEEISRNKDYTINLA